MTKKILIIFILLNFLELTSTLKQFKLIDRKEFIKTIPVQILLTNNLLFLQKNKLKEYINYEYKNNTSSNSLIKHFLFNEKINYNKSSINSFDKKYDNVYDTIYIKTFFTMFFINSLATIVELSIF